MLRRQGYTLVEVMTGVAIVGILAAAMVPNVGSYLRSRGSANGSGQLGAHLRLARSCAVMEGNDYVVQFVDDSHYRVLDDDGGGDGVPGSDAYVAANRGNGRADNGERVLGLFTLPAEVVFASVAGARNPFTGKPVSAAVTFPERNGRPTLVFHANGTAEDGGFVALSPRADLQSTHGGRCRVLQVLRLTGGIESRSATRQGS